MDNSTHSIPAYQRYLKKPFYGSSHYWAFNEILKLSSSARILDIGSGSGAIGMFCKERSFSYCAAVEVDPVTLEKTKAHYNRIENDLNAYREERFDLILLLDVLEHINDINGFFNTATSLLNPGGKILISLPNIAHWSVRLPLLFGYFEYTDRGILDKTHLHFFNRKRALNFIKNLSQLELLNYSVSIPPLEFILPELLWNNSFFRLCSRLHLSMAQVMPGFFGYQHLMVVGLKA